MATYRLLFFLLAFSLQPQIYLGKVLDHVLLDCLESLLVLSQFLLTDVNAVPGIIIVPDIKYRVEVIQKDVVVLGDGSGVFQDLNGTVVHPIHHLLKQQKLKNSTLSPVMFVDI